MPGQRLTIDLTDDMHRSFKANAALQGVSMVDLIRFVLADLLSDMKQFESVAAKVRQAKTSE